MFMRRLALLEICRPFIYKFFFICRPFFMGLLLLAVDIIVSPEATLFALFCSSCILLPGEIG